MERAHLPPHRDQRGRFVAGNSGRPRGPNRVHHTIREAIVLAPEELGSDGRGAGGLLGFLKMVARKDLGSIVGLLSRCVPLSIAPVEEEEETYRSVEEVEAELAAAGIDHEYLALMAENMTERQRARMNGVGSLGTSAPPDAFCAKGARQPSTTETSTASSPTNLTR